MNTTTDRYDTDLWDATATTFGAAGSVHDPAEQQRGGRRSGLGDHARQATMA